MSRGKRKRKAERQWKRSELIDDETIRFQTQLRFLIGHRYVDVMAFLETWRDIWRSELRSPSQGEYATAKFHAFNQAILTMKGLPVA